MVTTESEQKIISMFRNHEGGIGNFLSLKEKERITIGRPDKPENDNPIDEELLLESADCVLKNLILIEKFP